LARLIIQYLGWGIGLPLELLIIAALIRGAYRRFPVLLVYSVVLFLTTMVEISAYHIGTKGFLSGHTWARYYWYDEAMRQVLLFAVVNSLIYQAARGSRPRPLLALALAGGSILFAGGSFLIHHDTHASFGIWMTSWIRDLAFGAAVLDFGLWLTLLATRRTEGQVLLLSGGLGIQFTGDALGQSLRSLFPWELSPGDVIALLAYLTASWVWWRALRAPPPLPQTASRAAAVPDKEPSH
jgi:hypothetical protein